MRIAIGADHAGYTLKEELKNTLKSMQFTIEDIGAFEIDPLDDYPDFAIKVANKVASGDCEKGIVICGSGVGASIATNKIRGIRASVCHDIYSAAQGVEHDDMNILCLGARIINCTLAKDLVVNFINAKYSGEERHERRLSKIKAIDN
tara:strand:- start:21897 stop:22340 length:444 start_codon:yes stop_codon:yes gene_type:complete